MMSGYKRHYIPKLIRVLRGRKPQREIAESAGISVSYLSDIERGRTEPTLETLEKVFNACGARLRISFVDDRLPDEESDWLMVRKSDIQAVAKYADGILTRYQGDVHHVTVSPAAEQNLMDHGLTEADFEEISSDHELFSGPEYSHAEQPSDPVLICDICGGCISAGECRCDERSYSAR